MSRNAQLICVLATLAVFGLQDVASAQTAAPRGPSQAQPRLRLTQPRIQVAGTQPRITPAGDRITHVVQRGETLWSIARRYGTSVAAVQGWNGLRGTVIRTGARLTIFTAGGPAGPPVTASRGEQVTHLVRRGDTLSSIARRYGTSVAAVQGWNGLRGTVIRVGARLRIFGAGGLAAPPTPTPTATSSGEQLTHVVRRGDTLSSIARRYGTSVAAVQGWNGLRGTVIQVGARLRIFGAGGLAAPPTATAPGEQVTHVIRRGDTLSSIARLYGTTVAALQGWNGLRGSVIRAGRRLTVFSTLPGAQWAASLQGLRFRVNEQGEQVPDLRAAAAIAYDPATGEVLWEENSQSQRSIASITKVMTAIVFLEGSPNLTGETEIVRSDVRRASITYLRAGYKVSNRDMLHLLLIASDNAAARAIARVSPLGATGFVARMNEKAAELGLTNTHYEEPSGLRSTNVSSAYDMARLMAYAGGDQRIAGVMQKQRHSFAVGRRTISIRSTNQLVRQGDVDVVGGKTGYIRRAGYCLATLLRLPEGGPPVVVVVLGARSSAARFLETRQLFSWLASRAQDLLGAPVEASAVATGS